MFNIESAVLENNLYGVDINEESVEITKLSSGCVPHIRSGNFQI